MKQRCDCVNAPEEFDLFIVIIGWIFTDKLNTWLIQTNIGSPFLRLGYNEIRLYYSGPSLIRAPVLPWKRGLKRGMASLEWEGGTI